MGKNLKDIVEEGFGRLSSVSERRLEILKKAEQIVAANGEMPSSNAAMQKLKDSEIRFVSEIRMQVEQLLEDMRQTIVQVADNDLLFQGSIKENLRLRINSILSELAQSEEYMLSGSIERRNSAMLLLDKELAADKAEFSSEASRLLAELDFVCKRSQSSLRQAQAEGAGKLSLSEQELVGLLSETFSALLREAEKNRQDSRSRLDAMFASQFKQLSLVSTEIAEKVSATLNEALAIVRDSCLEKERLLLAKRESSMAEAVSQLEELSKDSLSELEDSYEYSRQELLEKLADLHELTESSVEHEENSLLEIETGIKNSARSICADLTAFSALGPGAKRSRVDMAFADLSAELDLCTEDMGRKIGILRKAQLDAMSSLCSHAERTMQNFFSDFSVQLSEMIKAQDGLFSERENELLRRLASLEKKIGDTYDLLEANRGDKSR
ncbi:MAG: hypothetical protein K2X27_18800 [Candidatus Obscuribacterales bacterium]|nr:hypothetical protein [Candidatus Obscuribacterales bacterium]